MSKGILATSGGICLGFGVLVALFTGDGGGAGILCGVGAMLLALTSIAGRGRSGECARR